MVLPKLFFLCLYLGTVNSQYCELSTQNKELNEKKVDNLKTPKYVVFSKNQNSNSLKHVFEGFKR